MIVYNLEFCLLDKLNRAQKSQHVGVYSSLNEVESKKQELIKQHGDKIRFEIYPVENFFDKITLS